MDGELGIELKGQLAGILALAGSAAEARATSEEKALQIKMVAGVRFEPNFRPRGAAPLRFGSIQIAIAIT
jgi:hypothetical protein